jgi:hypothetical protein
VGHPQTSWPPTRYSRTRRRPGREGPDLLDSHLGPGQVGHRHLDHLGNLPLLGPPGHRAGQPGQERGDPEPGGLGCHRQGGQQLDPVGGQAELLVGLPQGGGGQVGVAGLALAAGQGELAAWAPPEARRTSTTISWPSWRR